MRGERLQDSRLQVSRRRGSMLVEFTLVGISLLFAIISLFWMCMGIFQYHTLAESVNATARWAAVHGAGCSGTSCSTTVAQASTWLASKAVGIPPASMSVTFTSNASTVSCNPLNTCFTNSAVWPSLAGNAAATTDISIVATLPFTSGISMWTDTHGGFVFHAVTFGVKARQAVVF